MSSSSSSTPSPASSCARRRRARVVLLVTKRSRCPSSRSRRTASGAPGTASPDTHRTPSMSRRIAAMSSPESIRVNRRLAIPLAEIELRFSRSSGPGGQHAQKTETRVEAVFDVEASATLTDAQKRRLLARAGPVVRAVAQDERSQWRNRETALERLAAALASGPSRASAAEPPSSGCAGRRTRLKPAQENARSPYHGLRHGPPSPGVRPRGRCIPDRRRAGGCAPGGQGGGPHRRRPERRGGAPPPPHPTPPPPGPQRPPPGGRR